MSVDFIFTLPEKGSRLLRVIVAEIKSGRIKKHKPETFVSYSEALRAMGINLQHHAGRQLQPEGLSALNEWVKSHKLPKITGLIIDKRKGMPGRGFFEAFGRKQTDLEWWLRETDKSIDFDW